MKLQQFNLILYLEDYEDIPEDYLKWKQEEVLHQGWMQECKWDVRERLSSIPEQLCVGIVKYHTELGGDIFLRPRDETV